MIFADFSIKCDPYILKNNVAFWGVGYIVVIRVVHGFIHFSYGLFVHCCTSFTAFHEVFTHPFKTYERKSAVGTTPLVKDAKCVWLPTYNNCLYKSIP